MRGHSITKRSGELIAADMRKRRWDYTPQRAHHNRPMPPGNVLVTVKTKASCAARNITTGAMTKVLCDRYITAADGTVSDAGYDIFVFNPGGLVPSGQWMECLLNEAGEFEFVVARCGT